MSVTYNIAKGTATIDPRSVASHLRGTTETPQQGANSEYNGVWPRVFLTMSGISMGLIMACSILNIITLNIGPATSFLDVYLVILCFFAFTAELRQVKCLRSLIYYWIRYLYFITTYTGRGFFYIFLGSLALGDGIMRYVAAAIAVVLGVMMIVVNMCVPLPKYVDPEVAREEEAYQAAAGIGQSLFVPSAETTDYGFRTSEKVQAGSNGTGGSYKPPGINEGPNAL